MNCKQGDLAIITKSTKGYEGRLVRCIRFIPDAPYMSGVNADSWLLEAEWGRGLDPWASFYGADLCGPDAWLRPIRNPGEDATDETLIYAGRPQSNKVGEAA